VGVKCGGHGVSGAAVPDGGLLIDLAPMGAARVNPDRRRAWVQGGALLRALDVAAQAHGLATTAGTVSHTGVGGLTLGGGMGWLARQHGLACDNVVSFELVLASGDVVHASADENSELYWGLRGGSGNFGVATRFEFRLHPVAAPALSVELDFPADDDAVAVACRWRDLALAAPREATYSATVMDGIVTLGFVWVGDVEVGRAHARGLAGLGQPAARRDEELTYLELQSRDDTPQGHAFRRYYKGHYLPELPDAAVAGFVATRPGVAASLQTHGGAIAEVPPDATAFAHRGTAFEYVCSARWDDAAEDGLWMGAAREEAAALEPFADGVYVNALSDDGVAGLRRAYPPATLARLTALKDAVDPDNVFRHTHAIKVP
jgi:FAD/FMN-containing dehydrogenase